jgi:hypothetical protein
VTIERTRYFAGQILDEADLVQEQTYLREKARRHNRLLHGWGIVCGLGVRPGPAGHEVTVSPGYALDPLGDEIVVADGVIVDLRTEDAEGNAVSPCPDSDRKRVRAKRSPEQRLFLAVRHAECATHPVPTGESVEHSRTRESFAVRLLPRLPRSYRRRRPPVEPESHPCPDPPDDPWVVLAEVRLDSKLRVVQVDCERHERRVAVC